MIHQQKLAFLCHSFFLRDIHPQMQHRLATFLILYRVASHRTSLHYTWRHLNEYKLPNHLLYHLTTHPHICLHQNGKEFHIRLLCRFSILQHTWNHRSNLKYQLHASSHSSILQYKQHQYLMLQANSYQHLLHSSESPNNSTNFNLYFM